MTARGIRNNNPGNIEKGDPWQGLADEQPDSRFATFVSPKWGIRAIARILITYQDKHGLNTVRGIINRWAPPSENDTESYIAAVERKVGAGIINVHQYAIMNALVRAIILHENGSQPYTDAQIDAGLILAGIEPPQRSLGKTGTVKGGQVAMLGTILEGIGQMSDAITTANPAIQAVLQFIQDNPWVGMSLILSGVGYMIWRRIDDRRRGLR